MQVEAFLLNYLAYYLEKSYNMKGGNITLA